MATRVSKSERMRTIIMEELPEPHKLKKITQIYLIPESILCIYLLLCLQLDKHDSCDDQSVCDNYTNTVAFFVFFCCIPFLALRVISLLCCKSLTLIPWQIFGIWFINLIFYAAWSSYALIDLIYVDHREFNINFINLVVLLVLHCTTIVGVICGIPLFIYKIYERADKDKADLCKKVGQIKLLPKVRYNKNIHTSMIFCTLCMDNLKHASSWITYLPCDARHYFHTKCVRTWLLCNE